MTSFFDIYNVFLDKITDDMYMEYTELDTYRLLEPLLLSAIQDFEFPRVNLNNYVLFDSLDEGTYKGIESDNKEVTAIIYSGGNFDCSLTDEEVNILATYMVVHWVTQQLASVENTRMKYSASDYKFSSQANHLQKLIALKKEYERTGFHLQRLYCRREKDENGIQHTTFGKIMAPT